MAFTEQRILTIDMSLFGTDDVSQTDVLPDIGTEVDLALEKMDGYSGPVFLETPDGTRACPPWAYQRTYVGRPVGRHGGVRGVPDNPKQVHSRHPLQTEHIWRGRCLFHYARQGRTVRSGWSA